MLTSAPNIMNRKAPANRMGQWDGGGMWMDCGSRAGVGTRVRRGVPWPSPYFCTQNSSRSCTTGSTAKLYTGGGEGIVHSRVRPSHGSAGAGAAERVVLTTLPRKTRKDRAMMKAPMVATRFQKFQPRSGA